MVAGLLASDRAGAALPEVLDRASILFCRMALLLRPDSGETLNKIAPISARAAAEAKIYSQINILTKHRFTERDREVALLTLLNLPESTNNFVSFNDVEDAIFRNIDQMSFPSKMAEAFIAFLASEPTRVAERESELFDMLTERALTENKNVHKVIERALFQLGVENGFVPEAAAYFENLPLTRKLILAETSLMTLSRVSRSTMVSRLRFQKNYSRVAGLLSKENLAPLDKYIETDLGLDGAMGYYDKAALNYSLRMELADRRTFSQPILNSLYKLVVHRLANAVVLLDQKNGKYLPVRLTYPSADGIVAIADYLIQNPTLWTPEFKNEFLKLTGALTTSSSNIRAVNFFSTYIPEVKEFLSISIRFRLDDFLKTKHALDVSSKDFNFPIIDQNVR